MLSNKLIVLRREGFEKAEGVGVGAGADADAGVDVAVERDAYPGPATVR